jgi:tetratricopeptide (TPR) repeat protein
LVTVLSEVAVPRLFERETELVRVERVFDRVGAGVGSVVVVEGPAGIGKSELLGAVGANAAARGFGVLRGRGCEFEEEIAFGVARQLFEPMLRGASPGERRRLLDGVAQVGARALGVAVGEAPADRFAAIHGLYWLCANRAERGPLVVSVDDVQWADDPSPVWLGYLARRTVDLPLLLVLGLRHGDPGGERGELMRLVGDGGVERLVLGPLSGAAVGAIVRAQLDDKAEEQFCAACAELTGGNPLFLRELLVAARDQGLAARDVSVAALRRIAPAAVGTSVLGRLGRLGEEAVALARAVAVLGGDVEVTLAARLGDLDPAAAELTGDRLAAAQILAATRPLDFFHPLIGSAIREDIAPGALRVAHRKAAALIDGQGEGEGSRARVAVHLLACGPAGDEWVVGRLRDAALQALEQGAPEIAAAYARRALLEPPAVDERPALLFLAGDAAWRAGQPDAVALLEEALAAARDDHSTLFAACVSLARAYSLLDQTERAIAVLERALSAIAEASVVAEASERLDSIQSRPPVDTAGIALTLEAGIAGAGMFHERTSAAALRRAEELRGRLGTLTDPPVYLLVILAFYAACADRATEAAELADRALKCEPYPPLLIVSTALVMALTLVERYDIVQRLCDDVLVAARRRGAIHELAVVSALRASVLFDCGALADAEADARWAIEYAQGVIRFRAVGELLLVLIELDELATADRELEQFGDPGGSRSMEATRFLIGRGRLRAAQGRLEEALHDFLDCGQRCARLGVVASSVAPWRAEAAVAYAISGDSAEARRLADEQLRLARASGLPRTLGISLRVCGLVEGGGTGLELLGEAVQTAGTLTISARARPRAIRLRRRAASCWTPPAGASTARARTGSRSPRRGAPDRQPGAGGADRRWRQATSRRDHRPRRADRR